jgi:hypothetical protein
MSLYMGLDRMGQEGGLLVKTVPYDTSSGYEDLGLL